MCPPGASLETACVLFVQYPEICLVQATENERLSMASVHQACLSLCPCSSTVSFHPFRLVHIICTAGDNIDPLHHSLTTLMPSPVAAVDLHTQSGAGAPAAVNHDDVVLLLLPPATDQIGN
ncbi:hypothetical protein BRADI_1g45537v3 [Brachypodium distachyon]|uniref:Uncharacterized protein n=1 Tax=Brachypodium distachyon TaxID=15368 RepID=A0A2K2DPH0_BRADI|nr:hypothetical protein BRADI_1g45537v3 [Brachypodium distachyon]